MPPLRRATAAGELQACFTRGRTGESLAAAFSIRFGRQDALMPSVAALGGEQ